MMYRLSFSRMHLQSSCRRALCPDWRCSFLRGLCTFPVRCGNRTSCSLCQVADCFLQIRWSVSPPGLYPPTCLWLAVLKIPGCVLTAKMCLNGSLRRNESAGWSGRWREKRLGQHYPAWEYLFPSQLFLHQHCCLSLRIGCFCCRMLRPGEISPARQHRSGCCSDRSGRRGCSDAVCIPGAACHRRQAARFPACCVRRKALPYCPANEMLRCSHASLWTLS